MPNLPAVCSRCGFVFGSGIAVENSVGVTLRGVSSLCPRCGGVAHVPDGIYNVLGNAIEVLATPGRSIDQLRHLQLLLEQASRERKAPEEVKQSVVAAAPELQSLASALPTTRNELYAFVTLLLTLISILIAGYAAWKPSGPNQAEIDAMVKKAMEQSNPSPKAAPKKKGNTKVGRNAPCPCGSGKKYKRCCLGVPG